MKEQIKYDFTKCNNLEFKANIDGKPVSGYLKITESGEVYVFFFGDEPSYDITLQIDFMDYHAKFFNIRSFSQWTEKVNLEIIPRNTETYNDWKVGDVIKCKDECKDVKSEQHIIVAILGEVIFATDMLKKHVYTMSAKQISENYKLVLTNYEQKLLKTPKEKNYPFKEGDRVLARDSDTSWNFDYFDSYREGSFYPYMCRYAPYEQCIPLNEHTWKLLGTTDEYKEKE